MVKFEGVEFLKIKKLGPKNRLEIKKLEFLTGGHLLVGYQFGKS